MEKLECRYKASYEVWHHIKWEWLHKQHNCKCKPHKVVMFDRLFLIHNPYFGKPHTAETIAYLMNYIHNYFTKYVTR